MGADNWPDRYAEARERIWALEAERERIRALEVELERVRIAYNELRNSRILSVVFGHHKGAPKPFALRAKGILQALGAEFPDGAVALRLAHDGGWTTYSDGGVAAINERQRNWDDTEFEVLWLSDELPSLAEMEQRAEAAEADRDLLFSELAEARRELRDGLSDRDLLTDVPPDQLVDEVLALIDRGYQQYTELRSLSVDLLADNARLLDVYRAAEAWRDSPNGAGSWAEGRNLVEAVDSYRAGTPAEAPPTAHVLGEVAAERLRQDAKWGEQNHPDGTGEDWPAIPVGGSFSKDRRDMARHACQSAASHGTVTWHHILAEEFCEAMAEADPAKLRAELVQTAAVCAAWVEAIDRRPAEAPDGERA